MSHYFDVIYAWLFDRKNTASFIPYNHFSKLFVAIILKELLSKSNLIGDSYKHIVCLCNALLLFTEKSIAGTTHTTNHL